MKELVKLFSTITGIFRSVVTIVFLLGVAYIALVDVNLLLAAADIAGLPNMTKGFIKVILIGIFALCFVCNFIVTRHIFKAGTTGKYHTSNLCFALIFIIIDAFIYVILRDLKTPLIYIIMGLNALIVINSIFGLIAKSRGSYEDDHALEEDVKPKEYLEFEKIDKRQDENLEHTKIKIKDTNNSNSDNNSNKQIITKDNNKRDDDKTLSDTDEKLGQTTRIAKKKEKKDTEISESIDINEQK